MSGKYLIPFDAITMRDIEQVGGKNASLGEMIHYLKRLGLRVPVGYATTSEAYKLFISQNKLRNKIKQALAMIDVDDINQLAKVGAQIRAWIINASLPTVLKKSITEAYKALCKNRPNCSVAVRSSATAEDLPEASFAGQQETYLNIQGIEALLEKVKLVYASLFTDRAIAYREHQGFHHDEVSLSVGIQQMVRSDLSASGVMFSCDTESGFDKVVFITSSYGLGEMVVQGCVNPDEFYVFKPAVLRGDLAIVRRNLGEKQEKMVYSEDHEVTSVQIIPVSQKAQRQFSISDDDVQQLAKYAIEIEKHYGRPMDIEWAKDGVDNQIYILQARPETVKSQEKSKKIVRYVLQGTSKLLLEGRSIGQRVGTGPVKVIHGVKEIDKIQSGDVLVADITDPDWEPVMKKASAIITNRGGRTCHAAIIAREMGIPAVVGCKMATKFLQENQCVTVSCCEGEVGKVYSGRIPFMVKHHHLSDMPDISCNIMMNVANPERAFDFQFLPNAGVGLARLEFIISQMIGVHPKACLEFSKMSGLLQNKIMDKVGGYQEPVKFYVQKLAEGISSLAAAFCPKRVIVRFSDFKTNEYSNLVGGKDFEPKEENPMLGFRGASRYLSKDFSDCFALECEAIKLVRKTMGLKNVEVMIPFVRSVSEAKAVIELLEKNGLKRGEDGLKIMMMCELPTNALLAESYLEYFDGFSIGSNDLTQLTLGLDRDSALVADAFDERDPAIKKLLSKAIQACKKHKKYIGICGQGPSDHPDFAKWLIAEGIDSISLNPDAVVDTWLFLAGEKIECKTFFQAPVYETTPSL